MRKLLRAFALLAALSGPAAAGSIAFTPGSGGSIGAGSDGTAQVPATILCGASASATLYAVCVNQAIVNTSGQLLTLSAQSGTWNIGTVTTLPALVAGSAIIGKVGIDQTTPGTTNGVQVNAALPAGSAIVGKFGIDQTTNGTTNGVNIVGCATGVCGLPTITANALVFGAITSIMTANTATVLIPAVSGQRIYVTSVACQNSSPTATLVQMLDGASTTLGSLAAAGTYGGDNRQNSQPLFVTTAGNAFQAKSMTANAAIVCNAAGYSSAN